MYIYLLTNKVNGKYYVGQTKKKNLQKYFIFKRWCARVGKKTNMPIVKAIAKYGWDNFIVDILAIPETPEQMNDLERIWIILLNARDPEFGYNLCIGGGKGQLTLSEEWKAKIGAANKGRKPRGYVRTELHRQQLRDRMKGNSLGTKFTSESGRLAILNETPENKAKRIAGIQRSWDRRRGITTV